MQQQEQSQLLTEVVGKALPLSVGTGSGGPLYWCPQS